MRDVPKEAIVANQYTRLIADRKKQLNTAKAALESHISETLEYESEVLKVIRGESKLSPDLLNRLYAEAKTKVIESENAVSMLESLIQDNTKMRDYISRQYEKALTWATMFDECDIATKKMIVSLLFKSIRVKRDYDIEIDLTVDYEHFGLDSLEEVTYKG